MAKSTDTRLVMVTPRTDWARAWDMAGVIVDVLYWLGVQTPIQVQESIAGDIWTHNNPDYRVIKKASGNG